ncbi:NLR family CARD domain-containing protein 3-like [Carassius carassius]|uniref:NLR family CARD domain-containing protein 3-like n=1 Tax=Carassius carassius TaxID=217509 RepID=UPI00286907F7|nr:NLR family CARD domain-containing protein 3-like [Carassius carassius]
MTSRKRENDTMMVKSLNQKESPEPSCVSMKSHQSIDDVINFSSGDSSADLRKLNTEEEDEGQRKVKHGFPNITLLVQRKANQTDLTTPLKKKLAPISPHKHKSRLGEKFQWLNDGISYQGNLTLLNEMYTELFITQGDSGEVNNEHEVRQIEMCRRLEKQEIPIKCNDIFKPSSGQYKPIRSVLTKGVAGIGKTVSVQKFILDWAEGKANQDLHLILAIPFRELNFMKEENVSLIELLHRFFSDIKELRSSDLDDYKVMFIFDGLDECRLPLNFQTNQVLSDVTQPALVDVLLTNLIKGTLLPSALIWITSRPAAASQIPPECVDRVTVVRGFSDAQKEIYFRKKINDQSLANRIITHIKSSRSLYIMCHIPVFCLISATVLERLLHEAESAEIPKTLTQMFTHFLIFQTKMKTQKYDERIEVDLQQARKTIFSLGKLAFEQLETGNLIFYEEDLRQCGIDVKEVSVYSGVFTQIFREEIGLCLGKLYSFVHLSIQEFFAALFRFLSFVSDKKQKSEITDFQKKEVDKALQSENGHMDLYLRFLLGLSLESNQSLLPSLLTQTRNMIHSSLEITEYIKEKIRENPSPEKTINLFHCLNELNDHFLQQEVQKYLKGTHVNRLADAKLSPDQWSALVFVLLNSEEELTDFELSKYHQSEEGLLRLLPVVRVCRKANLSGCFLTWRSCSALAKALRNLRVLNLSHNNLQNSGIKLLSADLKNSHCKLETLKLYNCSIGEEGFNALVSALRLNPSHLRELDVSWNKPGVSGVTLLSDLLKDPHCKLDKLQLHSCGIGEEGFAALSLALKSNPSHLRELNLSSNKPGDSGVKLLSHVLEDPYCKLEKLQLSDCSIGEKGCAALASALRSNSSHLRELNLSSNKPGDSRVKLYDLLEDPLCNLEKLQYVTELLGGEQYISCSAVLPALCHLFRLMTGSDDDPGYVLRFKAAFTSDLSKRKQSTNLQWLKVATALDPRFKDLKCLPRSEREEVWKLIKEESAQQPEPRREPEQGPPKKKMHFLLAAASDSDDEEDPASDTSVDRYRGEDKHALHKASWEKSHPSENTLPYEEGVGR